jgi:integrase
MNVLTTNRLDLGFIQPNTPMFSEVMQKVEAAPDLSATRRRDILSGLRQVARALNRAPENVPADAVWLQKRLETIAPAALHLSGKTWSNALSNARAGLVLFGIVERRISRKSDLTLEWRALWEIVLKTADPTLSRSLPRLVHFLSRMGVPPHSVSLEDISDYREALVLNELSRSPDNAYRSAVNAWNLAVSRIPVWPRQTFALPSRSRHFALDASAFPPSFLDDLERYLDRLAHPDPLDPEAPPNPLRPASIAQYRAMLLRFASILVHAGRPVATIDRLDVLVQQDHAEAGLRWMLARSNGKPTQGTSDMVKLLRNLAAFHVKVNEASQKRLDQLTSRLSPKGRKGMTPKNTARLRPLQDKATLRRLLLLPEQLLERAKGKRQRRYGLMIEEALAIAILLICPIRCKNLTQIHIETNLHRPSDGRMFLVFEPHEVKNDRRIEFELPRTLVKHIDDHLATRTTLLCPRGTPWLFPRRDGSGPLNSVHFAGRVQRRIRRETGLVINMHLFRHLAAMNWLTAHPGEYEVVRRVLGHSSVSQTIDVYAGFEASVATQFFANLIDAERRA